VLAAGRQRSYYTSSPLNDIAFGAHCCTEYGARAQVLEENRASENGRGEEG